jgi:ribonuclease HIII
MTWLNLYSLCSTVQLPNSIYECRCLGLDEAGNDAGDVFGGPCTLCLKMHGSSSGSMRESPTST